MLTFPPSGATDRARARRCGGKKKENGCRKSERNGPPGRWPRRAPPRRSPVGVASASSTVSPTARLFIGPADAVGHAARTSLRRIGRGLIEVTARAPCPFNGFHPRRPAATSMAVRFSGSHAVPGGRPRVFRTATGPARRRPGRRPVSGAFAPRRKRPDRQARPDAQSIPAGPKSIVDGGRMGGGAREPRSAFPPLLPPRFFSFAKRRVSSLCRPPPPPPLPLPLSLPPPPPLIYS